jgi:hypothetical protein
MKWESSSSMVLLISRALSGLLKLYCKLGWLYRGQLDSDLQTLRGTWGSNRKLWFGTFNLTKAS